MALKPILTVLTLLLAILTVKAINSDEEPAAALSQLGQSSSQFPFPPPSPRFWPGSPLSNAGQFSSQFSFPSSPILQPGSPLSNAGQSSAGSQYSLASRRLRRRPLISSLDDSVMRGFPQGYRPIVSYLPKMYEHWGEVKESGPSVLPAANYVRRAEQLTQYYLAKIKFRVTSRGFDLDSVTEREACLESDLSLSRQPEEEEVEPTREDRMTQLMLKDKRQELQAMQTEFKDLQMRYAASADTYQKENKKNQFQVSKIKQDCDQRIIELKRRQSRASDQEWEDLRAQIKLITAECRSKLNVNKLWENRQLKRLEAKEDKVEQLRRRLRRLKRETEQAEANYELKVRNRKSRRAAERQAAPTGPSKQQVNAQEVTIERQQLVKAIQELEMKIVGYMNQSNFKEADKLVDEQNKIKKKLWKKMLKEEQSGVIAANPLAKINPFKYKPIKSMRPIGQKVMADLEKQLEFYNGVNSLHIIPCILFLQSYFADGSNLLNEKECSEVKLFLDQLPSLMEDFKFSWLKVWASRLFEEYCVAWGYAHQLQYDIRVTDVRLKSAKQQPNGNFILGNLEYVVIEKGSVARLIQENGPFDTRSGYLDNFKRSRYRRDEKHFMAPWTLTHLRPLSIRETRSTPRYSKSDTPVNGEGGVDIKGKVYAFNGKKWAKSTMETVQNNMYMWREEQWKKEYTRMQRSLQIQTPLGPTGQTHAPMRQGQRVVGLDQSGDQGRESEYSRQSEDSFEQPGAAGIIPKGQRVMGLDVSDDQRSEYQRQRQNRRTRISEAEFLLQLRLLSNDVDLLRGSVNPLVCQQMKGKLDAILRDLSLYPTYGDAMKIASSVQKNLKKKCPR